MYYLFAQQDKSFHHFKHYRHADHETNFLNVADGKVNVATISSVMLQRFKEQYPQKYEKLKIIWTSPLIASDPLVWIKGFDQQLKNRRRTSLLPMESRRWESPNLYIHWKNDAC